MMFDTLQGLKIPEGVVTQIAKDGVILWSAETNKPIILEVKKITSDTYAGETTYTGEQFILLDIYPKTNGTVKVTYGGLTKTLTFSGTNAQQVFFGTFNGVSDSVTTPDSGTLTIEGGCDSFGNGVYKQLSGSKSTSVYANSINGVVDWGSISFIADHAFHNSVTMALSSLPEGVTSIGTYAFYGCNNLALTSLPSGITSIGSYAFYGCDSLALTSLPSGITSIGDNAFNACTSLALTSLPEGITSIGIYAFYGCSSLALTSLPEGITSIGSYAFHGCSRLALTSLPEGITSIGNYAFRGCSSLALTSLPGGITSIGNYAFYENRSLTVIEGLDVLEEIGEKAFYACNNIAEITIGANVTSIGTDAFYFTYTNQKPRKITVLATVPPSLGNAGSVSGISFSVNNFSIIVPKGCGEIYKTATYWSELANYITEAS